MQPICHQHSKLLKALAISVGAVITWTMKFNSHTLFVLPEFLDLNSLIIFIFFSCPFVMIKIICKISSFNCLNFIVYCILSMLVLLPNLRIIG